MAKKQQGYVAQKRDNDAGHIYFYNDVEHCEGLIKYHRRKLVKATLVIGDERAFTESEVKELLRSMMQLIDGDPEQVLAAIEAVNAKCGLGLSDPA